MVDYSLVALLLSLEIGVALSVSLGYLVSVLMNYFHQKSFTFRNSESFSGLALFRYGLSIVICWGLVLGAVALGTGVFGWHVLLSKLVFQPLTFVCGYWLMKYFVFPSKRPDSASG